MRKVAAPTSWWDVPEQDVITMPEISNSGAWVKNLNPIWSILILGHLCGVLIQPAANQVEYYYMGNVKMMDLLCRLNSMKTEVIKKEQTRKEKQKSYCHLQNNGNRRRKLLTPVVQL
jgi:hypothetical protein